MLTCSTKEITDLIRGPTEFKKIFKFLHKLDLRSTCVLLLSFSNDLPFAVMLFIFCWEYCVIFASQKVTICAQKLGLSLVFLPSVS